MTIAAGLNKETYAGNNTADTFDYGWQINANDELLCYLVDANDNASLLTLTTDYTVTGVGDRDGGTVITTDPVAIGSTLVIISNFITEQQTDLRNQGRYFPETIEQTFDYVVNLIKQSDEKSGRALSKDVGEDNFDAKFNRIKNVSTPTDDADAAPKSYIDGVANAAVTAATQQADRAETEADNATFAAEAAEAAAGSATVTSGKVIPVAYLKLFASIELVDGAQYNLAEFIQGTAIGGGLFIYDASRDKADHTGGTVIDPVRIAAWDGTHADLATLFTAGTGTGCLVLKNQKDIKPISFGAIPDDGSASAISANNIALNQYALVQQQAEYWQDYRGYTYHYDQTLDLTVSRVSYLLGDSHQKANVGRDNLQYDGTGLAVDANGLTLFGFGLNGYGLASATESLIGVRVAENLTHIDSSISGFGILYQFNGGFYHTVNGGQLRGARVIYDFAGVGVFNFTANATHRNFRVGIRASGGDGPCRLGGSWEKWTDSITSTSAGEPAYLVTLDSPYIENYPSEDVGDFIKDSVGEKYTASRAFGLSRQPVVGRANLNCKGITSEVFRWGAEPNLFDIEATVIAGSDLTSFADANESITTSKMKKVNINLAFQDSTFTGVDIVSGGGFTGISTAGSYTEPSGRIINFSRTLTLINGWATNSLSSFNNEFRVYRTDNGTVRLVSVLNGTSATNDIIRTLPDWARPDQTLRFTAETNNVRAQVIVDKDGTLSTTSREAQIFLIAEYVPQPYIPA